jgi:ABC-type cobalamin/Fe3+-siderophores transport system ATPase subunit
MKINHIRGPVGSGKSTMLNAIYKKQGAKQCLMLGGDHNTASVISALNKSMDRGLPITTLLIDEFNPRKNLKQISQHALAPRLVVHVAHSPRHSARCGGCWANAVVTAR